MVPAGRGWACVQGRRESRRNYKKAHPDRTRAGRKYAPSPHRLTERNGGPDVCSVCGPVEPKAWGRGYICPVLLKEKGWTSTQLAPAPKCGLCNKTWLVDGQCPRCDAQARLTENLSPAFVNEIYEAGMHIETAASWLDGTQESAVPGWKTLGSHLPTTTVRPEYAALYGAGSKTSR